MQETLGKLSLPEILTATDEEILAYMRRSWRIAEIAATAEREALIISLCKELSITVSEEELQTAGDTFRQERKLLGASETLSWLKQQCITVEDWSQGIRVSLLKQKLKEYLFGESVDSDYIKNLANYQRVALSQIVVSDLTRAVKIAQALQEKNASFCVLALEYSKGKQSRENGGFVGIRFTAELLPEITRAITDVKEGQIIGPIQTKIGYHILRVEKWFSAEMKEVRDQVLEFMFQSWLESTIHSNSAAEKSS